MEEEPPINLTTKEKAMQTLHRILPPTAVDDTLSVIGLAEGIYGLKLIMKRETPSPVLVEPKWFKYTEKIFDETHVHVLVSGVNDPCGDDNLPWNLNPVYSTIYGPEGVSLTVHSEIERTRPNSSTIMPSKVLFLSKLKNDLIDAFDPYSPYADWVNDYIHEREKNLWRLTYLTTEEVENVANNEFDMVQQLRTCVYPEELFDLLDQRFMQKPIRYSTGLLYSLLNGDIDGCNLSTYLLKKMRNKVTRKTRSVYNAARRVCANPHLNAPMTVSGGKLIKACYQLLDEILKGTFQEYGVTYFKNTVKLNFIADNPDNGYTPNELFTDLNHPSVMWLGLNHEKINSCLQVICTLLGYNSINQGITLCKTFNESLSFIIGDQHSDVEDRCLIHLDIPTSMMYHPCIASFDGDILSV